MSFRLKTSNCHSKEISKSWFSKVQISFCFLPSHKAASCSLSLATPMFRVDGQFRAEHYGFPTAGSPEVRFVKAENRKAEFAKSCMPGSRAVSSQLAIAPCSIKLADSPHASSADSSIQFLLKHLPSMCSNFDKSALLDEK